MNMNYLGRTVQSCVVPWDKYYEFIRHITNNRWYPVYALDGISYYATNETDSSEEISFDDLATLIANDLNVSRITSIHADDCEPVGVWITFIPYEKRPTPADRASEVSHMVNVGLNSKEFCEAMLREHKTLQQSFTRLCREWFNTLANAPDRFFDGRNEASQALAKDLAPHLHKVPLPFI